MKSTSQKQVRPANYIARAVEAITAATDAQRGTGQAELYDKSTGKPEPTGQVITVWNPFKSPINQGTFLNLSDKDGIESVALH